MATAKARAKGKSAPKREEAKGAGVLYVRDAVLAGEIDAWVARLNDANPDGPLWNRATLVRASLRRALRERGAKGEAP